MGKTLPNAIRVPAIFIKLFRDLRKQKKFINHNLVPLLHQAKITNDGTLTDKDFKKINKYYGLAVPAILGEAFCVLRGKPMSKSERWASTGQGVITGLFDDFFDDIRLPEEHIAAMVEYPESILPKSSIDKLFLEFYLKALQEAAHPNAIKRQLLTVHEAQVMSVEQENSTINNSRIWEITRIKGGNSVLFYRTAFDNLPALGEEEALFQLGSTMQLENDIFDIYKDAKSNIATLPTTLSKVSDLRQLYEGQINLLIDLCYKMGYPKKRIVKFLDRIMPVINRGLVGLDQYQRLENSNGGEFDTAVFSRKQLICDMEKPRNILKTIKYQLISNY